MIGWYNTELAEWVPFSNLGPLPGPQVKVPVAFVTSRIDGALMHAVPHDWNPDAPAPACRWRQSKAGNRGFCAGNIEYIDDVFAAIAYGRPFCQGCSTAGSLGQSSDLAKVVVIMAPHCHYACRDCGKDAATTQHV